MSLGYLVMGVVAVSGLAVASCGAMTLAARATARLLGVTRFRWFDAHPAPAAWWKRLWIRAATMAMPFALSALLFTVGLLANGEPKQTGRLEVNAGAAREAGMADGDRIVRVGTRNVANWDEMRSAVQELNQPTNIEVERNGSKLKLLVTPRAGRIGVAPQFATERVGPLAALRRGVALPWTALSASAHSLFSIVPGRPEPELRGPVGIVKDVRSSKESGSIATYLALLMTQVSPWLAGVCLFDALTLAVFQGRHPEAQSSGARRYRLQRYRQALLASLAGYALVVLALLLVGAGVAAAVWVVVLAIPAALASLPLLWVGNQEVGRSRTAAIAVVGSVALPCFMPVVGVTLLNELRRQLRAEDFASAQKEKTENL